MLGPRGHRAPGRRVGAGPPGGAGAVGGRRWPRSSSPSWRAAATVAVGLTKLLVQRGLAVDLERHLADEAFAMELSSRSEDFQEFARSARETGVSQTSEGR